MWFSFVMLIYVTHCVAAYQSMDVSGVYDDFAPQAMKEAYRNVKRAARRTEIKYMKENIWDNPMTLFQFFKQPPNEETMRMAIAGDVFECALNMMEKKVRDDHHTRFKRRVNATDFLTPETIDQLVKFSGCLVNRPNPDCPSNCYERMYRSYSGMCNNDANPWWGSGNIPLARWLPSQYENDFSTPIGWNSDRLYNGYQLPIVRKVSNDIVGTKNEQVTDDGDYSHMLVVWGQYIDHDMDLTPQSLSTSTFQGLTDCSQTCENEPPCYPMMVPEGDQRITGSRCLPFFRSASVCGSGDTSSLFQKLLPREQINAATSFVDASTVYGSTASMAYNLRNITHNLGEMRVNTRYKDVSGHDYLPFNPSMPCVQDQFDVSGENIPCFLAGDPRSSEHLTLASIHTIWVREHNRIARELRRINPHWDGEVVYQEARKIVGAYHQVVHWKQYVPKILGPNGLAQMGDYEGYKDDEDPSISNVFATAAFRFGHVTISPDFRRLDEDFQDHPQFPSILLHEAFFSPWRIVRQGGLDPILRGLIGRPAKLGRTSQLMHEELRERLFALQNQVALDLASLNLQRGRDHALPLYNDWREECGLMRANNFSDVANEIRNETIRNKLEELYGHPGNIDIWMAGLAEDLVSGSRLGPTFTCLIARQFKFLRNGDKFYYERDGVFTPEQRSALDGMTFARVLCENSGLTRVQSDVFALTTSSNTFVSCDRIPALDLSLWREEPEVDDCGTPPSIERGFWKKCGSGVTYRCKEGTTMSGSGEVQCVNGRFTPAPPSCNYMDPCESDNGGCEETCESSGESALCECGEGKELAQDGRSCMPLQVAEAATNTSAVVTGVVLGAIALLALAALAVVIYKFMQLQEKTQYRRSGRFNLDDQANVYDNPSMKNADGKTKIGRSELQSSSTMSDQ